MIELKSKTNANKMKNEVYISYAWSNTKVNGISSISIVDRIKEALEKNDITFHLDKKDVKYKDDIREFEKRLGNGEKIILVISDKFLKSRHCMYEMLKIYERGDVYSRIFPIVLHDADIYDPHKSLKYVAHWEKEIKKLDKKIKGLNSTANLELQNKEISNYTKFRGIIGNILNLLNDMNTLTPEMHNDSDFSDLIRMLNPSFSNSINDIPEFSVRIKEVKKLITTSISLMSKELKDDSNGAELLKKINHCREQCEKKTFQIAVMALIKSGKSTFLNALLGDEYLPTSSVVETAVPVKINHCNSDDSILSVAGEHIYGVDNIRSFLMEENKKQREKGAMKEVHFFLSSKLIALAGKDMAEIKFEILDTPGFGEEEPLNQVIPGKTIEQSNEELLDKVSVIIYLLDYTKLKTTGEAEVLNKLKNIRPDLLDKIQERIFFIINKIDAEDRHGLTPEEAIHYVYNLVKPKMNKLTKKQIFTTSANQALLSRLIIYDKASEKAKKDFGRQAFGLHASKKNEIEFKVSAKEILGYSNIESIESNLIDFIYENRGRLFIDTLLDQVGKILNEFRNKFIITAQGTLSATIEEIETLEKKILEAKKKQENIQDDAARFENDIKQWIEEQFRKFEKKTEDNIDSVFNADRFEHKKSLGMNLPESWINRFRRKVISIFSQSVSDDKEDVAIKVRQLNIEILEELSGEFLNFRRDLEFKIFERQKTLLSNLENSINNLARDFESTLKKSLRINLATIELKLDGAVDFEKAQLQANSLIERFIQRQRKVETVQKTRDVYKKRWCVEGRWETEQYFDKEIVDKYSISKNGVELFWKNYISEMNTSAKETTKKFIDTQISLQIRNARRSFDEYVVDYVTTIKSEKSRLTTGDIEDVSKRIDELNSMNKDIEEVLSKLDVLYQSETKVITAEADLA